jgi:hypothetical protein
MSADGCGASRGWSRTWASVATAALVPLLDFNVALVPQLAAVLAAVVVVRMVACGKWRLP